MKKLIRVLGIFAAVAFGLEMVLFALDTGKYMRLLEAISEQNVPAFKSDLEFQSYKPVFNPESLFVKRQFWVKQSDILEDSVLAKEKDALLESFGIKDSVIFWSVIEWRIPFSRMADGYSCGPLCGHGKETYYLYLFGYWIRLFNGSTWVA